MSSLCLKVLQGAQLIAVASSDPAATGVDGSPLQGSDIQVQYVQLAPVTDHTAAAQVGPPFGKCTGPGAPAGVDTLGPFYLGPSSVRKVSDRERRPCGPRRSLGILSLVSAWKCEGEKSVPGPGTSLKPVLEDFFQMGGDHIFFPQFGGLVTVSRETGKVLSPSCYQGNFLSCIQGPRTRHI